MTDESGRAHEPKSAASTPEQADASEVIRVESAPYETEGDAVAEPDERYVDEPETSLGRWILETVGLVLLAFVLAQGIKTFIVQPFVVPTGSMIPTILIGDRVLAEKITYRFERGPAYKDIVVFDDPNGTHTALIKRVIATAGQTVDVRDGAVWVDGKKLDEPYTHDKPTTPGSVSLPVTIPPGYVWLMGDNRPNSGDSRFFGPQPIANIRGRGFWTYWPPTRFGALQ